MPGPKLVWKYSEVVMFLNRTCKEATAIMVAKEDRTMPWSERLALRLHLLICKDCPSFERQLLSMRNSMKEWRNYTTRD